MIEPKIIYVVTRGDYSDYHIEALFSNKEDAELYVQRTSTDAEIEEWPLDMGEALRDGYFVFRVKMLRDGTAVLVQDWGLDSYRETYRQPWVYNDILNVFALAKDEQHAIKIANEKRTQLIALNQWEAPHG